VSASDDTALKQTYEGELVRLERLAKRLLERQFKGPQDLWNLQIDTINYQIELQDTIKASGHLREEIKSAIRTLAADRRCRWKTKIRNKQAELRDIDANRSASKHIYKLSRQFGDALAWCFLGQDRSKIVPFTRNKCNPPCPTGASLKGVLSVAELYAGKNMGFPIINDMTNVLRIGDLTYVSPHADPFPVEVKTRILNEDEQGITAHVHTLTTLNKEQKHFFENQLESLRAGLRQTELRGSLDRDFAAMTNDDRYARQMKRMEKVSSALATKPRTITWEDDSPTYYGPLCTTSDSFHWNEARDLAARCKQHGYATQTVDGAFFYVGIAAEQPLVYPWSTTFDPTVLQTVAQDLCQSGIFLSDTSKNHLWYSGTASYLGGIVPPHVLPLFLNPFPPDVLFDLVAGRMMIFVMVNLGRLVDSLIEAGFEARVPSGEAEFVERFLPVSRVVCRDGKRYTAELYQLSYHSQLIVHEYLSLRGFVDVVRSMFDATDASLPAILERRRPGGTVG